MLILKLGGAAITDKTQPNTAKREVIQQIAALLAAHPQPLVLVHGAGSFGHIVAEHYQLHLGYQHEKQRAALVQLQQDLHVLNQLVIDSLIAAGLPAMAVHPASMCLLNQGRIEALFIDPIRHMLALGLLPVLYGDCLWDATTTFSILSGDQLVVYLANTLGAERVAFGTNVDGVLDSNGQVIPHLAHVVPIADQAHHPQRADVTGGMQGKLAEIAQLKTASACIFNLQKLDQLAAVLAGQQVGTLIDVEK